MNQVEKPMEVKIKNIGKLENAEVCVGQFTVFAGPNNTGKSFVSKLLYSLFNAMNSNYGETHLNNLVGPVYRDLTMVIDRYRETRSDKATTSWLSEMENEAEKLENLVKAVSIDQLDVIILALISQTERIQEIAADIPKSLQKRMEGKKMDRQLLELERLWRVSSFRRRIDLDIVTNSLSELKKKLHQTNAENSIVAGISYQIEQNLIRNFQVPNVSDLIRTERTLSEVRVGEFGVFQLPNDGVKFMIHSSLIEQLQQYSKVIYLESPVYWKLKTALEATRDYPVYFGARDRERLSGVPGYFYDLARALKFEYTGEMAFPNVYTMLTGKNVMGGKIAISETGDLSFREEGRSFSLPVTATGIANLGILALLIERKVLDQGTFLFIDEPEAHLHPAWQVVMAESLFELSRQGVNVVIATHSADILQWLDVHIKKNPNDEQLIALNQFPVNRDKAEEDFETKMGKIMHELTKPFSDLYIEGI